MWLQALPKTMPSCHTLNFAQEILNSLTFTTYCGKHAATKQAHSYHLLCNCSHTYIMCLRKSKAIISIVHKYHVAHLQRRLNPLSSYNNSRQTCYDTSMFVYLLTLQELEQDYIIKDVTLNIRNMQFPSPHVHARGKIIPYKEDVIIKRGEPLIVASAVHQFLYCP